MPITLIYRRSLMDPESFLVDSKSDHILVFKDAFLSYTSIKKIGVGTLVDTNVRLVCSILLHRLGVQVGKKSTPCIVGQSWLPLAGIERQTCAQTCLDS